MSLLHSYKRAKGADYHDYLIFNHGDTYSISDFKTKESYSVANIKKRYDYIKLHLYSLDFYGQSEYHRSFDFWRKGMTQYLVHHNDTEYQHFHFPFYYQRRTHTFQKAEVESWADNPT